MPKAGSAKIGMRKHGVSGHAGKSPKARHAMRREAEANEIMDRSAIKKPKSTVRELPGEGP